MAKTFFAGDDPIGKRIFFDFELQRERNEGIPAPRYEIVGVVADVLPTLDGRNDPTLYRPAIVLLGTQHPDVTVFGYPPWIAVVPDINGVCSVFGTFEITSKPTNAASTRIAMSVMMSMASS